MGLPWSAVEMANVAAVEKAGFLFPSRHELQTATWLGAGLSLLPLLHAGIFFQA